jgi:CRP-like cAMP-binding protein
MTAQGLFANARVRRTVSTGETIYSEGDVGTHMFGVVSGAVELRKGSVVVASRRRPDAVGSTSN